jgi:capsular exopolysaccharide synthesis family protein
MIPSAVSEYRAQGRTLSSETMANRGVAGDGIARYSAPDLPPDQPLEVGRYLDALRRSWLLIALIIVGLTVAVLVISLSLPKTYRATSKIVLDETADSLSSGDAESVQRRLATIQILLSTRDVLGTAAARLKGETADTLDDKVQSTVDQNANIVNIVASDDQARGAAAIANVVADTFLAKQRRLERQRIARARASLVQALPELRRTPGVQAQTEIATIRERLTDLNLRAASSGSELTLAEAAQPPVDPSSPRPVRNTIFAFFAASFIAALVVLARAQLRPRVSGSRELSRLLDLPVLVEVPYVRRRFVQSSKTLSAIEYEAYQTLQASLRMHLPPTRQQIVLVTSALHGDGKTEVTAALGLVLAQAGQRTWLVSADMRWPRLHELFDVAQSPGLSDVLAGARGGRDSAALELAVARKSPPRSREPEGGELHVLASGRRPPDPAQLLASDALDAFFEEVKRSDYDYVLLDGPPLLGLVDSQVLAQRVDGVLIACRPERLTSENAIDMRDLLQRLDVNALGLVIVGARGSPPSYFQA